MPRAPRPCSTPSCADLVPFGTSLCPACQVKADAKARRNRDPVTTRHYSSRGHRRFRRLVLDRDPLCVLCGAVATDADHWPIDLRDLLAAGRDPNDPARGRGLCRSCHSRETMRLGQGGW